MFLLVDQDDDRYALPEISRDDLPRLALSMNQMGEWLAAAFPDSPHDGVFVSPLEHGSQTRNPSPPVGFAN
jgi:hypothetical protein